MSLPTLQVLNYMCTNTLVIMHGYMSPWATKGMACTYVQKCCICKRICNERLVKQKLTIYTFCEQEVNKFRWHILCKCILLALRSCIYDLRHCALSSICSYWAWFMYNPISESLTLSIYVGIPPTHLLAWAVIVNLAPYRVYQPWYSIIGRAIQKEFSMQNIILHEYWLEYYLVFCFNIIGHVWWWPIHIRESVVLLCKEGADTPISVNKYNGQNSNYKPFQTHI